MENIFARKAKLKNHVAKTIEVGFSQYGPTLGICGVLMGLSHIIFIENVSVNLMSKEDGTQHLFDWFAFRPYQFSDAHSSQMDLTMPSRFTVTASHPYKYNIIFSDHSQYTAMNPTIKKIRLGWEQRVEKVNPVSLQDYENLFIEFAGGDFFSGIQRELQEMCYWEEGDYIVTMVVSTDSPRKYLEVKNSFTLNTEEAERLKTNTLTIVSDLCRQPGAKYNIINVNLL